MLNRVLRYMEESPGRPRMEVEADDRHVQILVKELGLSKGKGVDTPAVKKKYEIAIVESQSHALGPEMSSKLRSLVMRSAYLAQDRADIGEAVKRLSRRMQEPNDADWQDLKR